MNCKLCNNRCIKKGFQVNNYRIKQRYQCSKCKKYQLEDYTYSLYQVESDKKMIHLNSEGMSISGISRFLGYSKQTIIRRIKYLANLVISPIVTEYNQIYEVDEMWSYVGNKDTPVWVTYSINRKTHQIISYCIGARTKENLNKVIAPLKMLMPKKIVTDRLNMYPSLVNPMRHDTERHRNNRIERCNLTLRQHLKRLSRKTLCYSKSKEMLEASFRLYLFWNNWAVKEFN